MKYIFPVHLFPQQIADRFCIIFHFRSHLSQIDKSTNLIAFQIPKISTNINQFKFLNQSFYLHPMEIWRSDQTINSKFNLTEIPRWWSELYLNPVALNLVWAGWIHITTSHRLCLQRRREMIEKYLRNIWEIFDEQGGFTLLRLCLRSATQKRMKDDKILSMFIEGSEGRLWYQLLTQVTKIHGGVVCTQIVSKSCRYESCMSRSGPHCIVSVYNAEEKLLRNI